MYRQGDVLLVPCAQPNSVMGEPDRAGSRIVLLTGEATGHAHAACGPGLELFEEAEGSFLHVGEQAELRHEEHGPIALGLGWYRIVRQREYAPRADRFVGEWPIDAGFWAYVED